jgi:serine/threonine protein phosphatase 1
MSRLPLRRVRLRGALAAASVPTWRPPATPDALVFQQSPGLLRPGKRVYAIGDIHGRLVQLGALHARIADDLARRPVDHALLVHLGDYIDEGPDPVGVVALLAAGDPVAGLRTLNLMGDHERTALEALDGEAPAVTDWLHDGGETTLRGWGIDPASSRAGWRQLVPSSHLAFLRGLALQYREDDYLFVHAGIRPGVSLGSQSSDDLLRIRQPFLYSEEAFPAVVVHGHTPGPVPVLRQNRICIDTSAGDALTCAVLEDDRVGFFRS